MTKQRVRRLAVAPMGLAFLTFTGTGCATLGMMIGGETGGGMQVEQTPTGTKGTREAPSRTQPARRR